ncbi:DUF5359 family protein [Ectobacillus ponti]|uniref:YpfB family protein n=1 Tax=Ectobacillus ponti TaxID=2961894 RepID=A0AA41X4V5_9BACI|nr:DUF5359 family protein [Ectobacillus ponti]MCP8968737.1 YpfB family protein [Ectobacillus ponti]
MKAGERILLKILMIQLLCLLAAQALLTQERVAQYMSKVVYYEGVTKESVTRVLETGR